MNLFQQLQKVANGAFTLAELHQKSANHFEGRYRLDLEGQDYFFEFTSREALPTLKRLRHIEDSASNGRQVSVAVLRQTQAKHVDDLEKEWMDFDEWFDAFISTVRDFKNFIGQVLTDLAADAIRRRPFYEASRFNSTGFKSLPWFGRLVHFEGRRKFADSDNDYWLLVAWQRQQEWGDDTHTFLEELVHLHSDASTKHLPHADRLAT